MVGGVVAYAVAFPAVQLVQVANWLGFESAKLAWAALGTALVLPVYLDLAIHAALGRRSTRAVREFGLVVVLVTGTLVLSGWVWLPALHLVGVAGLLALGPRRGLLALGGLVVAVVGLSAAIVPTVDGPVHPQLYFAFTVLWRTMSVFLPLYLLGAIRRLDDAREELARVAVVRERLTIDARTHRTVALALSRLSDRGSRARALALRDSPAARAELSALVDDARDTLDDVRTAVRHYKRSSVRDELSAAAHLLRTAGVPTRVKVSVEDLPPEADELRRKLRHITARVALDSDTRPRILEVVRSQGTLDVAIRLDDGAHIR